MEIEVQTYGEIREAVGAKRLARNCSEGTTVGELVASLFSEFESLEAATEFDRGSLLILKNGRNVSLLEGSETPLEDGDRVSLSGTPMPE